MINYKNYIGWFIGSFVLFPVMLHFYSTFSINRNEGKKYYQSYINNSVEIKIKISEYEEKGKIYGITFKSGSYLASYSRSGSNNGAMDKLICYSQENKKYFAVTVFDFLFQYGQSKFEIIRRILDNKEIFITVNKDDLANPKYGTKENPIPVFNYKGIEKTIMVNVGNDGYIILEPTQKEYEHNVITYLTYIMPKEEFKERFEKRKINIRFKKKAEKQIL
ncbi:hypothetical protein ASF10_17075 [Flavobacterium sp. Leaf82]|jgi:hypothetical protein|uniref:hypothetical protein n=1 Tax=unclassified Flavobacterium TaxID=196869 RepID=UPI0006FF8F5F|nr:hypothetical protein [Flavobacterium sp. Leaf82]KQO20394.1 hypothetical protein ASF10_17075 [Flavobacterium sp. Leaf82]